MSDDLNDRFRADIVHLDGHAVVNVRGEIDIATAGEFRTTLDTAIDGTSGHLEINMRATTFMDSTGLAVLVAAHQRLGPDRQAMVVRDPGPMIRKVLDISGVAPLLDIRIGDTAHPDADR